MSLGHPRTGEPLGENHSDRKKAGIMDYNTVRIDNPPSSLSPGWRRYFRPTDTVVRAVDFANSADADPKVHWNYNPNKPLPRVDLGKKLDIDHRIIENPDYAMISLSDSGPDYHGIKIV